MFAFKNVKLVSYFFKMQRFFHVNRIISPLDVFQINKARISEVRLYNSLKLQQTQTIVSWNLRIYKECF